MNFEQLIASFQLFGFQGKKIVELCKEYEHLCLMYEILKPKSLYYNPLH